MFGASSTSLRAAPVGDEYPVAVEVEAERETPNDPLIRDIPRRWRLERRLDLIGRRKLGRGDHGIDFDLRVPGATNRAYH